MSQSPFTPEFIEERRRALVEQRIACRSTLEQLNDTVEDGGDLADRTDAELSRRTRSITHQHAMRELAEVDAALTKIERGTYGIDENTGRPISLIRLEAIPTARFDIQGQQRHERRQHRIAMSIDGSQRLANKDD
jgi:DnaK suppressor protein